jgi:hypothetical protein
MSVRDYISSPHDGLMFNSDIARVGARASPSNIDVDPQLVPLGSQQTMKQGGGSLGTQVRQPTIYDKIRERVKELEREQYHVGSKRGLLDELVDERKGCTKRHQIKRRRELDEQIKDTTRDIQEIESGVKITEFKAAAEPYVQAYQRQHFCRPQIVAIDDCQNGMLPSKESKVLNDYVVNVEGGTPPYDIDNRDTCKKCNCPMYLHTTTSMMVCARCGETAPFLDATASLLSYSDDSYEYCSFSYKRINHFSEWIASMQAKESTEIPQSVLDTIMQRLKDERIENVALVTVHKIREILKKFKLRKYYEHVQLIHNKITHAPPPRLTPEEEEKIKLLFMASSSAFSRVCPTDRRNFVSYSFIIQKLCRLLGYTAFQNLMPGLKGRQKVERQNSIWKAICNELDWDYEASMRNDPT